MRFEVWCIATAKIPLIDWRFIARVFVAFLEVTFWHVGSIHLVYQLHLKILYSTMEYFSFAFIMVLKFVICYIVRT